MLYIDVPDMNDSVSSLAIDGVEYEIRFTYNSKYDYWSFGLYNNRDEPIIAMTKIVPNFPIFFFYTDINIPDGTFGCLSEKDSVGRNDFKEGKAEFVYIPNVEVGG